MLYRSQKSSASTSLATNAHSPPCATRAWATYMLLARLLHAAYLRACVLLLLAAAAAQVRHAGMGYVPRRGSTIESIAQESYSSRASLSVAASGGAIGIGEEEGAASSSVEQQPPRVTSPDVRRAVARRSTSAEGVLIDPM